MGAAKVKGQETVDPPVTGQACVGSERLAVPIVTCSPAS